MAKHGVSLARGGLVLCSIALAAFFGLNRAHPLQAWLSIPPEVHVFAVALLGNLLFLAFPFRRRSDLALGLVIVLAAADIAASAPLNLAGSDAAGAILALLPVWTERLRARGRRERRQNAAWRSAFKPRPQRQGEQRRMLIDLGAQEWRIGATAGD